VCFGVFFVGFCGILGFVWFCSILGFLGFWCNFADFGGFGVFGGICCISVIFNGVWGWYNTVFWAFSCVVVIAR